MLRRVQGRSGPLRGFARVPLLLEVLDRVFRESGLELETRGELRRDSLFLRRGLRDPRLGRGRFFLFPRRRLFLEERVQTHVEQILRFEELLERVHGLARIAPGRRRALARWARRQGLFGHPVRACVGAVDRVFGGRAAAWQARGGAPVAWLGLVQGGRGAVH